MAETEYAVYELVKSADGVDESLRALGSAKRRTAKQAMAAVVPEPDPKLTYVAIPTRNITVSQPKIKPATVTW